MDPSLQRKLAHILFGFGTLLIGFIPSEFLPLLFGLALLVSILAGWFYPKQPKDGNRLSLGLITYPLSLLVLSLIFASQPIYVAIGWSVMAFGGGFTRVVGKKWGVTKFTWNDRKSVEGYVSFLLVGVPLTFLVAQTVAANLELPWVNSWMWAFSIVFAVTCSGLLESLKGTIHDNLIVPFSAAFLSYGFNEVWQHGSFYMPEFFKVALPIITIFALLAIISKKMDFPGALSGWIIALSIFLGTGFEGLALLFTFFVLGSVATEWRIEEKLKLEVAEKNFGTRSVSNAFSNGSLAAIFGLLAWFYPDHSEMYVTLLAATFAAATADTLSSEVGNVLGSRYFLITSLAKGTRGEDGVISLEGTLAGILGSGLIAIIYGAFEGWTLFALWVWLAGIIGTIADSFLGATFQKKGYLTNHTVNFANTLIAALLVYFLHP